MCSSFAWSSPCVGDISNKSDLPMLQLVEMFCLIQYLVATSYARTRVNSVLELVFKKSVLATVSQRLKKEARRYCADISHGIVWQHSRAIQSGPRLLNCISLLCMTSSLGHYKSTGVGNCSYKLFMIVCWSFACPAEQLAGRESIAPLPTVASKITHHTGNAP